MPEKVLVTGANGFIASEIVHQLLDEGKIVIGTVRTESRSEGLISRYPEAYKSGQLTFKLLDLGSADPFTEILATEKQITSIIHTASPVNFSVKGDPVKEILEPCLNTVKNLLSAIEKYAPQLKRLVFTSSWASITVPGLDIPDKVITEKSFMKFGLGDASENALIAYVVTKKYCDLTILEYFDTHKDAKFVAKIICPPLIFGPVFKGIKSTLQLCDTNNFFYTIWNGTQFTEFGPGGFFTDVRDIAYAHVQSADVNLTPHTTARYAPVKSRFTFARGSQILREYYGDKFPNIYNDSADTDVDAIGLPEVDLSETFKDIKFKHDVSFQQSIIDLGAQFAEMK